MCEKLRTMYCSPRSRSAPQAVLCTKKDEEDSTGQSQI